MSLKLHPKNLPTPKNLDSTPSRLPPYLTQRPLLFLNLLAPPVLGVLIVLITLILVSTQSNHQVSSAKREILAGCAAAQNALSSLNAIPSILEDQSRRATAQLIAKSVRAVGQALILAITVIEAVLIFLVDTFRKWNRSDFEGRVTY